MENIKTLTAAVTAKRLMAKYGRTDGSNAFFAQYGDSDLTRAAYGLALRFHLKVLIGMQVDAVTESEHGLVSYHNPK